jgi:hypothetical protein
MITPDRIRFQAARNPSAAQTRKISELTISKIPARVRFTFVIFPR